MSTVFRRLVGAVPIVSPATRGRAIRAAFCVAVFVAPASASAQIYYVDQASASCSPTGPGTEAQPYCTITAALNAHNGPGNTIRVKPGTYREQVTVPASGASGSPFVIETVGTGVIVDGADSYSTPASWVLLSGNVYRAAAVTLPPNQVFKNGTRLTPSTAPPASLPPNSFVWVSGEGLYVNVGGGNPGSQQLLVGQRLYGFNLNSRSWVNITGFTVRNAEDRGFNLGACSNVIVSSNDVSFSNGYGIRLSSCTAVTIQNNRVSYANFHGIGLLASTTGCIIRGNETFNNVDPAVSRANGIYLTASSNNTVSANRAHHNQDTGIFFTGGANNNIAFNNVSYANGDHGFDHLSSTGTIHVDDVSYGNFHDGFSIEGTASNTQLQNCISVNNGLTTNRYDLWVDGSSTGFVSDYNIFWNSTAQDPFKYIATPYSTIATYRTASGQDSHSLQADPRFANAGSGDFRLLSNSPAIDAANSGTPNWPSTDAVGHARVNTLTIPNTGAGSVPWADRGAFEFAGDQPPVVSAPPTASGAENTLLTVSVTASDPDGQSINSLTASGLPSGATFTAGAGNTSGTLTWTPAFSQAGTYNITFTANNALSSSAATQVTVSHTDRAPTVTAPTTASVAEGSLLTVNVTAADPDGDPITSLTTSALPAGATFTPGPGNATGTLSWTPGYTQSGTYSIIFIASNSLTGRDTTVVTVTNTNAPPVVVAPATATVAEGKPLTVSVTASDPDGSNINSLSASGVPSGASFSRNGSNTSGTLTWTPGYTQAGTYTVIFTASNSLTGRDTTVITVANTDRAPVLTAPVTKTGPENSALTVNITASDPDGDAITSLVASGLPTGATFTPGPGNTGGTVSWTPDFTQAGSYSITFMAANVLADTAITQVTITNLDRVPVVTAPGAVTAAENAPLVVSVTVADPDLDPITTLTAVGLPAGATFTPGAGNTTGILSWTPSFAQSGTYSITFTASNALSGAATTQVTVSNVDHAPVVTAAATASGAENGQLTINVSATDPDGDTITSFTATNLPAGATFTPGGGNKSGAFTWTPGFTQSGSYSVTFTASNALSGSALTLITISNTDRAPVVTAPDTAGFVEGEQHSVKVTAADPDGEAISQLTATGLPAGATFTPAPNKKSGTFTWTPGAVHADTLTVTFTARNAGTGSSSTFVLVTKATTGVADAGALLAPRVLPNPIRDSGQLRFGISRDGAVRVDIFDLSGRVIVTPMDDAQARAGVFQIPLSSPGGPGLYFYRVRTPDGTFRGRFLVRH